MGAALRAATARLGSISDTPRLDVEWLMAHVLGADRSDLLLRRMTDPAPPDFEAALARRVAGEPLAYIVGETEFYGLRLETSPAALIPRADSEVLIEAARVALAERPPARIIDLGTGSGALLLAALSVWPQAQGWGIDCSALAVAVVKRNAARHSRSAMGGCPQLEQRDWTQPGWAEGLGRFDLVLANPPYVETGAVLSPSVRDFEPAGALFAGTEGLDAYRVLIPQLPALLAPGGVALIEIGSTQAEAVRAIAAAAGLDGALHHDLAGHPRALELHMPAAGAQL